MAKISAEWQKMINDPGRVGILATVNPDGQPNAAYFGSLRQPAEDTLIMGLGDNRTLDNLASNPRACFLCLATSPVDFTTPGCRVYLKVKEIDRSGPLLEKMRAMLREKAGEAAAKMISAGVSFEVTEVRPLVDRG